jgi:ribonuclease P protein component
LVTLKRRADFLRVRGGQRWAGPGFVLEAKARTDPDSNVTGPRFGFTVTKRLGKAVVRNRIRRRLRAAAARASGIHAKPEFDYVVIARAASLDRPFDALTDDFTSAFARVHERPGRSSRSARLQRDV